MKSFNIYGMRYSVIVLCLFVLFTAGSCSKQDEYLNKKNSISDVTPSSVSDYQKILDDYTVMNGAFSNIGYAGTDNMYIPDDNLASLSNVLRNAYLWQKDIYETSNSSDWEKTYGTIERCNIVLDGLDALNVKGNNDDYDNVKGSALFFRTVCFYTLSQLFCKTYDAASANTDLGIIARTTSDVNIRSVRATVKQTYQQMVDDLTAAIPLLPVKALYQMRPSRPAASGLLAKVYLLMGDYVNAEKYASQSLADLPALIDFNNLTITSTDYRFPTYPNNPELSFYAYSNADGTTIATSLNGKSFMDTTYYRLYDTNDIRKRAFYLEDSPQRINFFGSYQGAFPLVGIASNEMYFIKAETNARLAHIPEAQKALNDVLVKRYKKSFIPVTLSDPGQLLDKIILERRKEFPMSNNIRWEDLRRLNKEPHYAVTLKRVYKGQTYTLPPNDPRYVYPIPDNEITLSGIPQNNR